MTAALTTWLIAAMLILQPNRDHSKLAAATATVIASEAPLFADDDSRIRTASLMVAVAFRESSFRDVTSATHDHGYFQLHDRAALLGHPEAQAREALHRLRDSLAKCSGLQAYVGGKGGCHDARATRISNDRLALAGRLLAETPDLSAAVASAGAK